MPDLASLDAINEDDHMGSGSMNQNIFSQDQLPGTSTLKPYEGPKREESLHFSSRVCRNYMEMNYNEVSHLLVELSHHTHLVAHTTYATHTLHTQNTTHHICNTYTHHIRNTHIPYATHTSHTHNTTHTIYATLTHTTYAKHNTHT